MSQRSLLQFIFIVSLNVYYINIPCFIFQLLLFFFLCLLMYECVWDALLDGIWCSVNYKFRSCRFREEYFL